MFIHLWDRKEQRETKEEMFIGQTLSFYFTELGKMKSFFISRIPSKYDDNNHSQPLLFS